jgi:hypothetical protein
MAAAAFVVLVSDPAASQTPSTNLAAASTDLLQPSLQGNPATLPRFRKPGQKRPSAEEPPPTNTFAPNRIGATPTYGSPSGLGAADTGFDSLNVSRAKRKTPAPPPVLRTIVPQPPETTFTPVPTYNPAIAPPPAPQQIKVPPPEVYPLRAAMRVGATLPPPPPPLQEELVNNPPPEVHPLAAANRPGNSLPAPGPQFYTYAVSSYLPDYVGNPPPPNLQPPNTFALGQRPQRLLPILAEPDPYAALGIRAGSFILLPLARLFGRRQHQSRTYTRRSARRLCRRGPGTDRALGLGASLAHRRHRRLLDAIHPGSGTVAQRPVHEFQGRWPHRCHARHGDQSATARHHQHRQSGQPQHPVRGRAAANQLRRRANRRHHAAIQPPLGITFDRTTYNPSLLTDGEYSSNADRNFDQYGGVGRIAYELDPGLRPFVQVEGDQRVHDEPFDRNNLQRESVGIAGKVGAAVNMFGSLTGEMAIGYVDRVYKDPTLPKVAGVIGDGAVLWQPSALTSAKLSATSQIYETTFNGASGQFSRDLTLEVDHAFRYWLIGILKGGYGNDVYPGSGLQDNRWFASIGAVYKLTREWQLNAAVRQDWQIATQPTFTYNATSVLLGVRAQR